MTETNVVEITVVDAENYERTFKLDNPKSNLTLAQIRTAFATAINEGWWVSASGVQITSIARAVSTVTTKERIS